MISASEQISLFEGAGPLHDSLPLWRYMKVSSLFLLLEGTSFLPSVAILRAADPVEGDLHPDAPWLNSVLSKLGGKEEADNLDTWLLTQAQEWERRYQGANKMNPDANTAFFVERALICRYEHNYFRGWVVSTKRRGSVSHGISRTILADAHGLFALHALPAIGSWISYRRQTKLKRKYRPLKLLINPK